MHYAEGLTDRQAADAVRTRIDWKYALRGPDIFSPHNPRSGPEALTVASILPATC